MCQEQRIEGNVRLRVLGQRWCGYRAAPLDRLVSRGPGLDEMVIDTGPALGFDALKRSHRGVGAVP